MINTQKKTKKESDRSWNGELTNAVSSDGITTIPMLLYGVWGVNDAYFMFIR